MPRYARKTMNYRSLERIVVVLKTKIDTQAAMLNRTLKDNRALRINVTKLQAEIVNIKELRAEIVTLKADVLNGEDLHDLDERIFDYLDADRVALEHDAEGLRADVLRYERDMRAEGLRFARDIELKDANLNYLNTKLNTISNGVVVNATAVLPCIQCGFASTAPPVEKPYLSDLSTSNDSSLVGRVKRALCYDSESD